MAVELEAVGLDLDLQGLTLVGACQDGAGHGQEVVGVLAAMLLWSLGPPDSGCPWRGQAQVGVVGEFGGAAQSTFAQAAFGQGLHPPGDAFDEPGAVAGEGGLVAQFGELGPQLASGQPLQGGDLLGNSQLHGMVLGESWER